MRATWFAVSAILGEHAHWMGQPAAETAILDARQLREMAEAGMEIGSHTRTHPDLTSLTPREMQTEITDSKKELEDLLGQEVYSFAYPYGRFNQACADAAQQSGYRFACSVRPGWFHSEPDPFRLRRVTIFADDSLSTFARKLIFADNDVGWGRMVRYAAQRLSDRLYRGR